MTQGIDSGKSTGGKRHVLEPLTPERLAELRVEGRKVRLTRLSRLRTELPPSAVKIIENCPPAYQDRLVKAVLGLASPKICIRAQCEQCVGWEDVKLRVGGCRSFSCALWKFRPYQKAGQ